MGLRPYQQRLVAEASAAYKSGLQAVLMQSATGSGKTRTATYIVDRCRSRMQVLWCVHREELLMQASMTFAENGIEHRLICAASSERAIKAQQFREFGRSFVHPASNVVVASVPTIVRRLDQLDWLEPGIIIPDECHLSLADTWRRVISRWPKAKLLGLTATPWRLDAQSFARADGGLYDAMVLGPSVRELIESGHLARYKVYAPPVHFREDVELKHKRDGDYDPKTLEAEQDTAQVYADVVDSYRKFSHGKPAILFAPTVAQSERFAVKFREAGYRAIALDGETDDTIRRRSLQQLAAGELDVVCSVSILVEGTDIPYATTAIWLRRTESLSLYLQGVGRVLRPHPKKEHAIILDLVGITDIHGFPDDDFGWSLDGASQRQRQPKEGEAPVPEVVVLTCPKCRSKHKPGAAKTEDGREKCPNPECDHVYPVAQRKELTEGNGELREVTDEEKEARQRARRQRMAMQGQAQTIEDLVAQGISRPRAKKIIEAREAKAELLDGVMAGIEQLRGAGHMPYGTLGVTLGDIRRAKPKELKELQVRIAAKLAELEAVAA